MMKKPRTYLLLIVLTAALIGPGQALAVDGTETTPTLPTTEDPSGTATSTDPSTESAPITIDQEAIDAALEQQAAQADDDKSVFEKASDFVTDNAPWFIIGIIVVAAIVAGILIMRGRPRKSGRAAGEPRRGAPGQPAQAPSAAELRRRKRAAMQRSREAERLRRKAEIENRKAARRGEPPTAPVQPVVPAAAASAVAGMEPAGIDPVEAEKQGARDQELAAAAMARFGTPAGEAPAQAYDAPAAAPAPAVAPPVPAAAPGPVPAPVSPSQTAPAAGVITPDQAGDPGPGPEGPDTDTGAAEPELSDQSAGTAVSEPAPETDTVYQPAYKQPEAESPETTGLGASGEQSGVPVEAEAETSVMREPSLENPGADAAVGNAARDFLAGGAAGAAAGTVGGLAAARASRPEPAEEEVDQLPEPVVAPEPGMAAEHALADADFAATPDPGPAPQDAATLAAEERLRAKVAEIKAAQEPALPPAAGPEAATPSAPAPLGPDADLSPGLAAVERKLSENSEERDRALRDAEERLRRVEQRAEDAERRAAFAERLAQLKVEESEREKRLNDVVSGIDRAEERAREAEARAEAAERAAAAALERSDLKSPAATSEPAAEPAAESPGPSGPGGPAPEAASGPPAGAGSPSEPAVPAEEGRAPERKGLFGGPRPASGGASSDTVNLNSATFEELREAGLSVTQATRILAYRERFGGYASVDDLEKVPGFPEDLIQSLKDRISV